MAEDIKINEAETVNDASFITVILDNGSLGKIAKVDLIELIKREIQESFLQNNVTEYIEDCDNLANYSNNGLYCIDESTKNAPPLTEYKMAFLWKLTIPGFYYQICVEPYANNRWYRWYSHSWSDWNKI